ncbi:MAG: alpha/beta hydrolase, partial [Bacteroidetes bacterium]|nr:alpha/beta hydrolase [Bacteroidota bacterium]
MKKTTYIHLFVFLIASTLISCSTDDDAPNDMQNSIPLNAAVLENVSYGNHPERVYDLYLPEGRTKDRTKTIVLIHGGSWSGGDKDDMTNFIAPLQASHPNHAILNINYVLADANTPAFPNQFLDIQAILEKLTEEQQDLAISDQFGFIGTSAGAHLSLMYDALYDTNDQVKFVANIVGPTDFTDPFYANDPSFPFVLSLLVDESAYPQGDYACSEFQGRPNCSHFNRPGFEASIAIFV